MKGWHGAGLASVLLLASCHDRTGADWVNAQADPHIMLAPILSDDAVVPVDDGKMARAVKLLEMKRWLRVTSDQVGTMCSCRIDASGLGDWYLVRAVGNGIRGGHYVVRNLNGNYDIYYGVLSHWQPAHERAAVFLRLPAPPKTISAGASVVE